MASSDATILSAVKTWAKSIFQPKGNYLDSMSVSIDENAGNDESTYKLDIKVVDEQFTTPNLKGSQGIQGLRGEKGDAGATGPQGIQGIKGDRGDDGYPFLIYKEYTSLTEFNAADFPEIGLMFMIKEEGADGFPVYRYTGDSEEPYSYITSLSGGEAIKGDKGDPGTPGSQGVPGKDGADGITYQPTIGTVEKGDEASASVVNDDTSKTAKFNFILPKGDKGDKGNKGDSGETPYIGDNGNWWYGDEDSGVPIPSIDDLLKYVDKVRGIQDTPIGHILTYMGNSAPNHYLICDGSIYSIADYPYLTEHFQKEFGTVAYFGGNGSTTFAVPDLRGEFLRGTGVAARNTGWGEGVGIHQDGTEHVYFGFDATDNLWNTSRGYLNYAQKIDSMKMIDVGLDKKGCYYKKYGNSTGSSESRYTSRPTNTAVLYCIKYEPTYYIEFATES